MNVIVLSTILVFLNFCFAQIFQTNFESEFEQRYELKDNRVKAELRVLDLDDGGSECETIEGIYTKSGNELSIIFPTYTCVYAENEVDSSDILPGFRRIEMKLEAKEGDSRCSDTYYLVNPDNELWNNKWNNFQCKSVNKYEAFVLQIGFKNPILDYLNYEYGRKHSHRKGRHYRIQSLKHEELEKILMEIKSKYDVVYSKNKKCEWIYELKNNEVKFIIEATPNTCRDNVVDMNVYVENLVDLGSP